MRAAVLAMVVVASGCGGRRHDPVADAGRDAAGVRDAEPGEDSSVPPQSCDDCAAGVPVALFHECTPPLEAFCAARTCTPGGGECGDGETCEECAAAACCECAACVPACVRTESVPHDALPEYLKLGSTWGPAGQDAEIVVEGAPFYVGALGYSVRIGDSGALQQTAGSACGMSVIAPGEPAGTMLPVWVSHYGFEPPWVLAGFFSWISGDDYPTCAQPGFPCEGAGTCCETDDAPMACSEGRCRTR